MPDDGTFETANEIVACVSLGLYAVFGLCAAATRLRMVDCSLQGTRSALCQLLRGGKVRSLVDRERLGYVKRHVGKLAACMALWLAASIGYHTRLLVDFPDRTDHELQSDLVLPAMLLLACSLMTAFPRHLTAARLAFFFMVICWWPVVSALSSVDVIWVSDACNEVLAREVLKRYSLLALMGITMCDATVSCPVLLLQAVARSVILSTYTGQTAVSISVALQLEVVSSVLLSLLFLFVDLQVHDLMRDAMKSTEATELRLLRLLYALYDVVVTLGPDLCVSVRTPKLANLLLHRQDAQGLVGTAFADLMGEVDHQRFLEFVARAPDVADEKNNPAPAQVLNVHLKDGYGSWMQVQLFHTQFHNFSSDQVEHLIGICEVGDGGSRPVGDAGSRSWTTMQANPAHRGPLSHATSVDGRSTIKAYTDQDSDCSLVAGDSASATGVPVPGTRTQQTGNLDSEDDGSAELPEKSDIVAPLRGESEDLLGGFSWRSGADNQPGEVTIAFDTLRFSVRGRQSGTPVLDASLLTHESLQQWVSGWQSCRAWMQDFVNAVLRPISAESWPPLAGVPASVSFRVAFRGTCSLPTDVLSRAGVPQNHLPQQLPLGSDGAAAPVGNSSGDGEGGSVGPPVKVKLGRVRLSSRHRLDERRSSGSVSRSGSHRGTRPPQRNSSGRITQELARSELMRRAESDPASQSPVPVLIGVAPAPHEHLDVSRDTVESC